MRGRAMSSFLVLVLAACASSVKDEGPDVAPSYEQIVVCGAAIDFFANKSIFALIGGDFGRVLGRDPPEVEFTSFSGYRSGPVTTVQIAFERPDSFGRRVRHDGICEFGEGPHAIPIPLAVALDEEPVHQDLVTAFNMLLVMTYRFSQP